jgi:glycerol-3-phosphate acyltransferase PlsY
MCVGVPAMLGFVFSLYLVFEGFPGSGQAGLALILVLVMDATVKRRRPIAPLGIVLLMDATVKRRRPIAPLGIVLLMDATVKRRRPKAP